MSSQPIGRRRFLKHFTAGAAGVGFLHPIAVIQESFARTLSTIPVPASRSNAFADLRRAYSLSQEITYFNHGSIGTIPKPVQKAHQELLETCETNPWLYMWGGAWEEARSQTREKAAKLIGCPSDEVALTHNTTEGFNLLAAGLPLGVGDEVLFSSLNHPGASVCWFHQAEAKGFLVRRFGFPVLETPKLTEADILNLYDEQISSKTRVLVFPHIDNMVGLRHPAQELTSLARSKGVEFVAVDGAQAVGMIPVDVGEMGADFYAASPHKWLQAPKGLGLLFLRKGVQQAVRPMWVTWGQERWKGTVRIFEDYGTRNLPEVLALGNAIDFQLKLGEVAKEKRLEELWKLFRDGVERAPGLDWRSPTSWKLSASLYAIEVEGRRSQEVFERMYNDHGFVFRPFETQGLNTLRVSPNVINTEEEIDRFFDRVA